MALKSKAKVSEEKKKEELMVGATNILQATTSKVAEKKAAKHALKIDSAKKDLQAAYDEKPVRDSDKTTKKLLLNYESVDYGDIYYISDQKDAMIFIVRMRDKHGKKDFICLVHHNYVGVCDSTGYKLNLFWKGRKFCLSNSEALVNSGLKENATKSADGYYHCEVERISDLDGVDAKYLEIIEKYNWKERAAAGEKIPLSEIMECSRECNPSKINPELEAFLEKELNIKELKSPIVGEFKNVDKSTSAKIKKEVTRAAEKKDTALKPCKGKKIKTKRKTAEVLKEEEEVKEVSKW